ncbi:MAG TPA: MmcQ/YjbR family DNA-binding protein [Caulobacteraceae bacterium]|nr:MmcQ/YjbR family DNA-binding protein [Caulobacteraceae bacterium]
MTADEAREIILSFPEVEEGLSYGRPSFLAFGKFLTRLRAEDQSFVIMEVGFDEREMLMEVDPATFHYTAHYKDYPAVLARLSGLEPQQLRGFIERRWRKIAPKRWLKQYDAAKE